MSAFHPLLPQGEWQLSTHCRHSGPPKLCDHMGKSRLGSPSSDPSGWARSCRIEAVRAIHPSTRAFLLKLAAEFEAVAGEIVKLDPDDPDVQDAVADRLAEVAAR